MLRPIFDNTSKTHSAWFTVTMVVKTETLLPSLCIMCTMRDTMSRTIDWLIEQGLTSPPTQYRLSGWQFYRSKDPTYSIKVLKDKRYKNKEIQKKHYWLTSKSISLLTGYNCYVFDTKNNGSEMKISAFIHYNYHNMFIRFHYTANKLWPITLSTAKNWLLNMCMDELQTHRLFS